VTRERRQANGQADLPADETPDREDVAANASSTIAVSNLSLHELFAQQAHDLIERADLDEEAKQGILVAMACPCCGVGGMSYSIKLKAEPAPPPAGARSRPRRPRKSRGR
jgi:hypothetical protein